MRLRLTVMLAALAATWCAHALTIDEQDIGITKMIPAAGQSVTWRVPVVNDTQEPFEGEVTVTMRVARRGDPLGEPLTVTEELTLAGAEDEESLGERRDVIFEWTPERNGWYRAVFDMPPDVRVEREIAVTERDLWFVWFGAPQQFRWCNVPTTVKTEEDTQWWLRRGAIPAHWKGGVCYKQWPVERFVESWGSHDWIAIDEIGGPSEVTDKFIEAWKRLRDDKPHQWIGVWYMGAHHYWAEVADLVDLFLPEIYLNYRGNHLGQFDSYLKVAREAGVIDQVIPALGINQRESDRGLITVSPTRQDVLRQFRYLKRTAPELNGIGFFTAYSAAPGVAEYADELCGKYYVEPVVTIERPARPIEIRREGDGVRALARVRNVGGMDAQDVTLEWAIGWPADEARLRRETVSSVAAGKSVATSTELPDGPGWGPVELRIVPDDGYTVLDGRAQVYTVWRAEDVGEAVAVSVPATEYEGRMLRLATVPDAGPRHLIELLPGGHQEPVDTPCAVLPPRPGRDERQAAFSRYGSDRPAMLLLRPGESQWESEPPPYQRDGDRVLISNDAYQLELELAADAISSITPAGGGNVLRQPWVLNAEGHEGFGKPRVEELPGALVVTIPWDGEIASGQSQYVFFAVNPAIRIGRVWRPKGEVTLSGAGDRCGLFQRGGSYALQPGVGGPVRRGWLHDSDQYRDLLFGYLGGRPSPENADRAGWIDFSYGDDTGGLGVAIEYRWADAGMRSYDVTRLYDASDWLEVLYLWGTEQAFTEPQTSCVWLIPHGPMDLLDEAVTPPAKVLWDHLHAEQIAVTKGLPQM